MHPAVRKLADAISQYDFVEKIILFGSRARGDHNARSDIDIAIVAKELSIQQWLEIEEATEKLDSLLKIDIVDYNKVSQQLKQAIDNEGVILYEHTR